MKRLVWFALVAAIVFELSTCVIFVDEREYAYITRFGELREAVTEAGLHTKLPWPIERVRRLADGFDRRLQIYEPPALERLTRDKKSLTVGSYVCWRIDKQQIDRFFRSVGSIGDAHRLLDDRVSAQLSAEIGQRDLVQLVSVTPNDSELESMLTAVTNELKKVGEEYGIEVVDVRLKRFNHPSEVRPAIYDRIRSERNRDAVNYRAEGDSEAQRIRSRADLKRDQLLAEAESQAMIVRGEADAKKTSILNKAHAQDPELYTLLRTLEAYAKILDDQTTLVLSTDNAIFRLLTQKGEALPGPVSPVTNPSPTQAANGIPKTGNPGGNSTP